MFTGIVQHYLPIVGLERFPNFLRYQVGWPQAARQGLQLGASVAIDGVCQTVATLGEHQVTFEAIAETLRLTTLKGLQLGQAVNVERSLQVGAELGGHWVAGHVQATARIVQWQEQDEGRSLRVACQFVEPSQQGLCKYLFYKGYVAIDGISLTLVEVVAEEGRFTVALIPETRSRTSLGHKVHGDLVNIEPDAQNIVIVDTVERLWAQKNAAVQAAGQQR